MEELLRDPVFMRGVERWISAFGGIILCFLGYKLFTRGLVKGRGKLMTESTLLRVTLTGTGPGLFFMAFGAILLITAILTKIEIKKESRSPTILYGYYPGFDTAITIELPPKYTKRYPTVYPYGGTPDIERFDNSLMDKIPLSFKNRANFKDSEFLNEANFTGSRFENKVNFSKVEFHKQANFAYAHFSDYVIFDSTKFNGIANFEKAVFKKKRADFKDSEFLNEANFTGSRFENRVIFSKVKFHKQANFAYAHFSNYALFDSTKFNGVANFEKAVFKKSIRLSNCKFSESVDFTGANFDSVNSIVFYRLNFPEGRLYCNWDQFKAIDGLRIRLPLPTKYYDQRRDYYTDIWQTYNLLRDNFIAQNNMEAANAVDYELAWQRQEILQEFWWKIYGWLFGWGYQPWRFLVYLTASTILGYLLLRLINAYKNTN